MIDNGYIHRDLKPENILIKYIDTNKDNFDIKLSDFGLSYMQNSLYLQMNYLYVLISIFLHFYLVYYILQKDIYLYQKYCQTFFYNKILDI